MSNWVDLRVDVLASSNVEINQIELALQDPCDELLVWRAEAIGVDAKDIAKDVKAIVSFKSTHNLGFLSSTVNKARRFENEFKDRFWGLVFSHLHFVSRDFPKACFLTEYWDGCMSYGGKVVIHAGKEICSSCDGDHHAQAMEWVLPNIFAPFRNEYELGIECGSLWDEWMEHMQLQLARLAERYCNRARDQATAAERSDGPAPSEKEAK